MGQKMQIYGHRGCRGLLPENTIAGFEKSLELGSDGIEWDVVINKENKLIISHEPYIDTSYCQYNNGEKINNKSEIDLNIYSMAQQEIEQFDCGSIFQPKFPNQALVKSVKPTVKFALEIIEKYNPTILFEIKSSEKFYEKFQPNPKEYAQIIKKETENYTYLKQIIFMSFDKNIINELYRIMPEMRYVYLIEKPKFLLSSYINEINFKPYAVGMYHRLINSRTIKYYHKEDIRVFAWTVNQKEKGMYFKKIKLDGLITDYPNLFIE